MLAMVIKTIRGFGTRCTDDSNAKPRAIIWHSRQALSQLPFLTDDDLWFADGLSMLQGLGEIRGQNDGCGWPILRWTGRHSPRNGSSMLF